MHGEFRKLPSVCRLLGVALLVLGSVAAQADSSQDMRQRQRTYQQDRQFCLSGQSGQSQQTCLREAGAVRQQSMAALGQTSAEQLAANAVQRCEAFAGDARQSCLARMQGQGTTRGSVAGGGILRELTETVP